MSFPNSEGFVCIVIQPCSEFFLVPGDSLLCELVVKHSGDLGNSLPARLFVGKWIEVLVVSQGLGQLEGWLNVLRDFVVNLQVARVYFINIELTHYMSRMIKDLFGQHNSNLQSVS